MKIRTILLSLFVLACFGLNAQNVISSEEMQDLLNSSEIQVDNPIISNFMLIRQIDQDNTIDVIQNQQGSVQNTILLNQNGADNTGYIQQSGSGLQTSLAIQIVKRSQSLVGRRKRYPGSETGWQR